MHQYLIALGSNQRHARHGDPSRVITETIDALDLPVLSKSRIVQSRPIGPSARTYANAAVMVETGLDPRELLSHLKAVEAAFGRRCRGRRWSARVLDLDIILWSGGIWATGELSIPHPQFRARRFVLHPASEIAPDWRDPVTGLGIHHLKARLDRKRPYP